ANGDWACQAPLGGEWPAMKLGPIPENPLESLVNALGKSPQPLLETHIAMLLARAVMEGARLGVYEALAGGPLTAAEVAARWAAIRGRRASCWTPSPAASTCISTMAGTR